MKEPLDDILMQFMYSELEPFSLAKLLEYLGEPDSRENREDLSDFLVFNQLAYLHSGSEASDAVWITRAGLFSGKSVTIQPTNKEVSTGILIPGSRCVPFCNPSLMPHEYTFRYKGVELPRILCDLSSDEVLPLYMLFGEEYIPQYLALDNEKNNAIFFDFEESYPVTFSLSAVDLTSVYWDESFTYGDCLSAKVIDWADGVFELSLVSPMDPIEKNTWIKNFEDALIQVFEVAGPGSGIDEQLSFAFFLDQENLFVPSVPSVSEVLALSKKIGLEPYGVETRLWYRDVVIPSQSSWIMNLVVAPTSIVEEAFLLLAIPVNMSVMDSYIQDALFLKENDTKAILERLIPVRYGHNLFCIPVVQRELDSRFQETKATYNLFADHEIGVLRNRFVTLHSALSRIILELHHSGVSPDDIPEQGAVVLEQLLSHTISALETIDSLNHVNIEVDALWASIEGMEDSFFDTRTAIMEVLPNLHKKRFHVIKKKDISDERF
ncbi:MAG TPA: hypothetical protein VJ861_05930 [Treponemataceae bacterium]|nr:hypothetical protein [Treponemataceae bacterium]